MLLSSVCCRCYNVFYGDCEHMWTWMGEVSVLVIYLVGDVFCFFAKVGLLCLICLFPYFALLYVPSRVGMKALVWNLWMEKGMVYIVYHINDMYFWGVNYFFVVCLRMDVYAIWWLVISFIVHLLHILRCGLLPFQFCYNFLQTNCKCAQIFYELL